MSGQESKQERSAEDRQLLQKELAELMRQLERIRAQLERANGSPLMQTKPPSLMYLAFLQLFKGIFLGLGSVLGASIVVSIVVYLLSQIEFIPIIGELINRILVEIQAGR